MSEHLPDSFDPTQPDLPTMAVDPEPHPAPEEGEDTRHFVDGALEDDERDGR